MVADAMAFIVSDTWGSVARCQMNFMNGSKFPKNDEFYQRNEFFC